MRQKGTKRNTFINIVAWFFTALFVLGGIGTFIRGDEYILSGVIITLVGLVLCPSISKVIKDKTNKTFSAPIKAIIVIVLIITLGATSLGDRVEANSNEKINPKDDVAVETVKKESSSKLEQEKDTNKLKQEEKQKKLKELENMLLIRNDDMEGIKWINGKDEQSDRQFKFLLYIGMKEGYKPTLRLRTGFVNGKWIFTDNIKIKVGEKVFDIPFNSLKSRKEEILNDGNIAESIDIESNAILLNCLDKLINSQEAKIRFTGTEGYVEFDISAEDINNLKPVYEYYKIIKE